MYIYGKHVRKPVIHTYINIHKYTHNHKYILRYQITLE